MTVVTVVTVAGGGEVGKQCLFVCLCFVFRRRLHSCVFFIGCHELCPGSVTAVTSVTVTGLAVPPAAMSAKAIGGTAGPPRPAIVEVPEPTRPGDHAQPPRPPLAPRPAKPQAGHLAGSAEAPHRRTLPARLVARDEAAGLCPVEGLFEPLAGLFWRVGVAMGKIGPDHGMLGRGAVRGKPVKEPPPRRGAAVLDLQGEKVALHTPCYYIYYHLASPAVSPKRQPARASRGLRNCNPDRAALEARGWPLAVCQWQAVAGRPILAIFLVDQRVALGPQLGSRSLRPTPAIGRLPIAHASPRRPQRAGGNNDEPSTLWMRCDLPNPAPGGSLLKGASPHEAPFLCVGAVLVALFRRDQGQHRNVE